MAAIVSIIIRCDLTLIPFNIHLKQLYISNKMERFSYKGATYVGVHIWGHLKDKLPWAIDKWIRIISNIMLIKTVTPLRH